jgi:dimethylargininase
MHIVALTRPVPDSISNCELTHLSRVPIDAATARAQHAAYEVALAELGCEVRHVPAAHEHPDSVFIEDVAVVLDELAVITRPGAFSRRGETAAVAETLRGYRQLEFLSEPATLDGGDVLRLGRTLYVGIGGRSNEEGARQLAEFVRPFDYGVCAIGIGECLHLKSAVTEIAPGVVLLNPAWIDARAFKRHAVVEVDAAEPAAANVLRIGDAILAASAYDRTNATLDSHGFRIRRLDVSELAKAEAGVTCCSVILAG